jgi:hypothetical protein
MRCVIIRPNLGQLVDIFDPELFQLGTQAVKINT